MILALLANALATGLVLIVCWYDADRAIARARGLPDRQEVSPCCVASWTDSAAAPMTDPPTRPWTGIMCKNGKTGARGR